MGMVKHSELKWAPVFSDENPSLGEMLRYASLATDAGVDDLWTPELGRAPFAGTADEVRAQALRFARVVDTQILYSPTSLFEPARCKANHREINATFADWN